MYGIGSVGSTMTRMLVERGATVVGAVAATPEKNGKDVGELIGLGEPLGVQVYTDPDEALALKPDIVVMSIASYMEDMYVPIKRCIKAGVNVISLAEELLYSWHTSAKETAELDVLAKEHEVRVLCTGHQDGYWVSLVSVLMGTCFKLDEVHGQCTWNVDDFGAELARDQQVGTTPESFEEWASTSQRPPTFGRTSLHVLAAMAGLEIVDSTTKSRPDIGQAPLYCKAFDAEIPAGQVIGFTDVDKVTTRQGITLGLEMTGKVYAEGETDSNAWEVRGEPTVRILSDNLATHYTTCGTLVNRIPQLLVAEPGYRTIDGLPQLQYQDGYDN
jgi:4-hydroxy-tetrahydrodipicolinate reductase